MNDLVKGFEAIVPLYKMCKGSDVLYELIIEIQDKVRTGDTSPIKHTYDGKD